MKWIWFLFVGLWVVAPAVGDETSALLQRVAAQQDALCQVRCVVQEEGLSRSHTMIGVGVCIEAGGMILTQAIDPQIRPESITALELILPGRKPRTVKAKLLGIDPLTGLGFLQAQEAHAWTPVAFVNQSGVKPGDPVASIGLAMNDPALTPTLGVAYVAGILRTPVRVVDVTGGTLSGVGSVVFDAKGRAIGLVGPQPLLRFRVVGARGDTTNLALQGEDNAVRFLPVEEFAYRLGEIPQDGKARPMPWLGIVQFQPVSALEAEANSITTPAVRIDQVVPGHAAAKQGLQNRDLILGLDGAPLEDFASPDLVVRNFQQAFMRKPTGQTIVLNVLSGGARREVTLELEAMPRLPRQAPTYFHRTLGMLLREKVMLDQYLDKGPTATVEGLVVEAVAPRSPADQAGLRQGDVVTAIDDQPMRTADQCKEIIQTALEKTPSPNIRITIQRGGSAETLTLRPGAR
jgi:serine protease Do